MYVPRAFITIDYGLNWRDGKIALQMKIRDEFSSCRETSVTTATGMKWCVAFRIFTGQHMPSPHKKQGKWD